MGKELSGSCLCFRINGAEHNTFFRLPVKNNSSHRCGEDERDYRKVFFAIDEDSYGGVQHRMFECALQLIGQGPGRIFNPDALSPDRRQPAAG